MYKRELHFLPFGILDLSLSPSKPLSFFASLFVFSNPLHYALESQIHPIKSATFKMRFDIAISALLACYTTGALAAPGPVDALSSMFSSPD